MAVDVVIPTFNARDTLLSCLAALVGEPGVNVIVVDDVSDDDTVAAVRATHPDAVVVALEQHRGLAHAFNAGARAGDGEHLLFLNNDIIAAPGAIGLLVEALAAHPEAASAGGRLVDPGTTTTQDSYRPRDFPGLAGLAVRLTGVERAWPRNPWTGGHLRRPLDDACTVAVHQQPAGACLLVRRRDFEAVGGWDERFWFWYEDVDLSRRLDALGPALYVPAARFEHIGRHSTTNWDKPVQHRRLYHGTLRYGQSHLSRARQVVLAGLMATVCAPRIVRYRRTRPDAAEHYRWIVHRARDLARGREIDAPADGRRRSAA